MSTTSKLNIQATDKNTYTSELDFNKYLAKQMAEGFSTESIINAYTMDLYAHKISRTITLYEYLKHMSDVAEYASQFKGIESED